MTRRTADVGPRGFAVDGGEASWGAFAHERDPLVAAVRAFVGARSARLPRLDRAAWAALVAVHLVLDDGPAPQALVVAADDGSAGADRAFWATAAGRGGADASPTLFAATLPSAVAGELAMSFGVRGPCVVLAGGGASDAAPRLAGTAAGPWLEVSLRGWDRDADGDVRAALSAREPGRGRNRSGPDSVHPSA